MIYCYFIKFISITLTALYFVKKVIVTKSILGDPLNRCWAELFYSIFHSFEARIADAISSLKWRKIFKILKNGHLPKIIIIVSIYHNIFGVKLI